MKKTKTLAIVLLLLLACGGGEDGGTPDTGAADGGDDTADTAADVGADTTDDDAADGGGDDIGDADVAPDVAVAELRWDGEPAVSETTGDGDMDVEPGESWEVSVGVAVDGGTESVTVRLTTISPRIEVTTDQVVLDDVGGDPVTATLGFRVLDDAGAGDVRFKLEAFAGAFARIEDELDVTIVEEAAAQLVWSEPSLREVTGDGDERVEADEVWAADSTLSNRGTLAAADVTASAEPSSDTLIVSTPATPLGAVAVGAEVDFSAEFTASADPIEARPVLSFVATTGDDEIRHDVDVPYEPPDRLVLDSVALEEETGNGDAVADVDETWAVVFTVTNAGRLVLEEVEFRPLVLVEGTDWAFSAAEGPATLEAGAQATVRYTFPVVATTSAMATVQFRVQSAARPFHGPFAEDLVLPQ